MDNQSIGQKLHDIYHQMMSRYGPQYWWPAEEPFEVMVGAILTQSAAWRNVEKAIANLRATGVLSPRAIRQLSLSELAAIIYPSGYYNAKARKLKALVQWLGEYQDNLDNLFTHSTDQLRQELLSVHGVGEETADAIILYTANKPVFVIDAYTRRIVYRLGLAPKGKSYAAYQALFSDNLPADPVLFNEYHALLVCLGKDVCRRNPLCRQCCLREDCEFGAVFDR
ncbi:MAG: endonuclease [Dehalococcoidales bacterium]|nr:MAG: endonuclease [Dehalococcoidales bacterium]